MSEQSEAAHAAETAAVQDRVKAWASRVQDVLDRMLPSETRPPETLHAAMRYTALGGGKRIRPALVYTTGEALGVPAAALDAPAAAIELVHCYSLVHDDLPAMDDDALRRGQPTTHRVYGEATAILVGDALQALAFELVASNPEVPDSGRAPAVAILARAAGADGMVGGQSMDLAAEGEVVSEDYVEDMFRRKTGGLIWASIMMACCGLPDLDDRRRQALDRAGRSIGLAFQIRDDILDIEGDTQTLGKTAGADAAHDKAAYPARFGMDRAQQRVDELYRDACEALDVLADQGEPLQALFSYVVRRDA